MNNPETTIDDSPYCPDCSYSTCSGDHWKFPSWWEFPTSWYGKFFAGIYKFIKGIDN